MMTIMIWLLFLCSLMIFVLCIILVVVKPPLEEPHGNHHSISRPYQKEEDVNVSVLKDSDEKKISILYSEISILFEKINCEEAYILRYKGLSKKSDYILYVFQKEASKSIFMSTIEKMIENNDTPFYNILIAFLYNQNSNDAILKAVKEYSIKYIFTDDSEIRNLPNTDGSTAFIGVGRKPYAVLNIQHEMDDHEWLSTLNSYKLFTPVYSFITHRACKELRRTMQSVTSFELLLPALFKNSIMYDYMMKYPETISWFCSVLDKEDTKIVVYSPDELSLVNSINQLKASASNKNIAIKVEKGVTNMNLLKEDDVFYDAIKDMIHTTLKTEYELPILCENYAEWKIDIPVISFSPTMQGQIENAYNATNFYTKLLILQSKKAL